MKKFLASLALSLATICSTYACWFTADNFNGNYIAGVNNYQQHYKEVNGLANAVYRNGMTVSLPLTVFVKISPRYPDQTGQASTQKPITSATLQYKVKKNGTWGNWVTVKTITNTNNTLNWNRPIALFGKNNIYPKKLSAGDEIMIRLYLTDGTFESGDLNTDITSTVSDNATQSSGASYQGGWTAPFVFRVIVSGKERPTR